MTPGLYYYYLSELAFYWSLVFSQFTDIKRKVSRTGVVWSTLPMAVMVVIILDGHMFVVLWSQLTSTHAPPPLVCGSFVCASPIMWSNRPNSITITWLPLNKNTSELKVKSANGKVGQLKDRVVSGALYASLTSGVNLFYCSTSVCSSHDLPVRCTCLLKLLVSSPLRSLC